MLRRPASAEIDTTIVDAAAALFARRGEKDTALQAIADEVGYSKAAVIQRFGPKAQLLERVVAHCIELSDSLLDAVADVPDGPGRDALAVSTLTDIALAHPGFVAMLVGAATNLRGTELAEAMDPVGKTTLQAFGVSDWDPAVSDVDRTTRVVGCLATVSVLSALYRPSLSVGDARPHIITAAYATLHGPGPAGDTAS